MVSVIASIAVSLDDCNVHLSEEQSWASFFKCSTTCFNIARVIFLRTIIGQS